MKKTSQFKLIHDKNFGPTHFKFVFGVPFKFEKRTVVFEISLYKRSKLKGDLVEMLKNTKFDEKNSVDGQTLHTFLGEKNLLLFDVVRKLIAIGQVYKDMSTLIFCQKAKHLKLLKMIVILTLMSFHRLQDCRRQQFLCKKIKMKYVIDNV